ncbi:MAG TPA: hypothetical protein VH601_05855 [Bryobacteraceae bacterium]
MSGALLIGVDHAARAVVVDRDGPERLGRNVGPNMQLVTVAALKKLAASSWKVEVYQLPSPGAGFAL